jgi:hypothetical protein
MEDLDTEYEDAYDDAELYDDSEAYDDAESRASSARRRRARALAAARRRAAALRQTSVVPARPAPRAVVSAVKELDLETKVQQDNLRSVVAGQNKKLRRANLAAAATVLVNEGLRTFGEPDNTFVRAGIQASPLLLLPSASTRGGVAGYLTDPRFIGIGGALGLAFIGNQRNKDAAVGSVNIIGPTQLGTGSQDVFVADVFDGRGKASKVLATWQSDNTAVAAIDATTGRVTAGTTAGVAIITATAGDVVRRVRLEVAAASGQAKSSGQTR